MWRPDGHALRRPDGDAFQGNQYHATRQGRVGSRASGTSADPCLRGGALPGITSPTNAKPIVPRCPHEGLDLRSLFGVNPGLFDYFGHRITTPPVVGAAQP
ncbi:hypothetical protein STRIP9103_06872 [Streptomyces ipomoeae 91-03]|uniref:Uncharacterized protein n=1 Tax=Streptomyces ipomoeae 91-03 TaxID=698759 RepID=L1KZX8_9ACTN|nr:hypothetical protein STRIP9103_06872 [Streptomyces ipomoeae 91-03]